MVEVRVRNKNQVDRRQIAHPQPRTAQPLQHKKPACKVGIDRHALPAHLQKKAGVTDEGESQFAVIGEAWLVGLSATWGDGRMAHQMTELSSALAQGRIAECGFDHTAADLGVRGKRMRRLCEQEKLSAGEARGTFGNRSYFESLEAAGHVQRPS